MGAKQLLVIVGPTAVGKTVASLHLAQRFDGAIVSADSRLVYRGMDIGTAKPTPAERTLVFHYLIDMVDPDEPFGLAQFQEQALAAIAECHAGGRLPLLVGGTGQYIRCIVEGWGIPRVPPQSELRARLEQDVHHDGPQALYSRLAAVDPEAADRIDSRNVRRVIRALEVFLTSGVPISVLQRKSPPPFDILQIGLRMKRTHLNSRIDARVDAMLSAGLLDEVRRLREAGYADDLPSMSGLGYRQLCAHLRGEVPLGEAVEKIRRDTRHFVHQQMTWFRESDPAIVWLEAGDCRAIEETVAQWLRR
jgi:tRNA dimethylallyltransferase